jgi:hypothetical protein
MEKTTMANETLIEIEELKKNYQQILEIKNEGDNYRSQLSKILPSSIDNRLLFDNTIEQLDDDDDEENDEGEDEDDGEDDAEVISISKKRELPILHDKTARHIGGITYGKLRDYKNYYLKYGKIRYPDQRFIDNE